MIMPNYLPLQPPSTLGVDGYMSWIAWPLGVTGAALDAPMTTFIDQLYMNALFGAPYMASVSPWFYRCDSVRLVAADLAGISDRAPISSTTVCCVRALYEGATDRADADTLLVDRWPQILAMKPAIVQLIRSVARAASALTASVGTTLGNRITSVRKIMTPLCARRHLRRPR